MGTVLTLKSMLSMRKQNVKSRGKNDRSHRVEGRSKRRSPQKRPEIKKEYPMVGMKLWVKVPSENLCKRQLLPTPDPYDGEEGGNDANRKQEMSKEDGN